MPGLHILRIPMPLVPHLRIRLVSDDSFSSLVPHLLLRPAETHCMDSFPLKQQLLDFLYAKIFKSELAS